MLMTLFTEQGQDQINDDVKYRKHGNSSDC